MTKRDGLFIILGSFICFLILLVWAQLDGEESDDRG